MKDILFHPGSEFEAVEQTRLAGTDRQRQGVGQLHEPIVTLQGRIVHSCLAEPVQSLRLEASEKLPPVTGKGLVDDSGVFGDEQRGVWVGRGMAEDTAAPNLHEL